MFPISLEAVIAFPAVAEESCDYVAVPLQLLKFFKSVIDLLRNLDIFLLPLLEFPSLLDPLSKPAIYELHPLLLLLAPFVAELVIP